MPELQKVGDIVTVGINKIPRDNRLRETKNSHIARSLQSRSQNAINGVPPHPSYILQTTDRMIGSEIDISDTRVTLTTTVTLACAARQASASTHGYLCTCEKSCSSHSCRGIKVSHIYEYLP